MVLLRLGMNFPRYVTMPKNRCSSSLLSGLFIIHMAFTLSGSGFNPSLFRMCQADLAFGFVEFEVALAGTF